MNEMTLIKMYELGYIQQGVFLELILGCGQRTIAEEGVNRFKFYLEREAGRISYDYYVLPYNSSLDDQHY